MGHAVVATGLEDVQEAHHVGLAVHLRVGQRVAHAGLRRQVDHQLRAPVADDGADGLAVGDVLLVEGEPGVTGQSLNPGL